MIQEIDVCPMCGGYLVERFENLGNEYHTWGQCICGYTTPIQIITLTTATTLSTNPVPKGTWYNNLPKRRHKRRKNR